MDAELDACEGAPVGMIRAMLEDPARVPNGVPAKMVKVMIDSVDQSPAPKRLMLASRPTVIRQKRPYVLRRRT